jgi:hypothetical protein
MVMKIYGRGHEQLIRQALADFSENHPTRGATHAQAAIHEAGHFIAFEVDGMVAGKAQIEGSPFGRNGWRGSACAWERPLITPTSHTTNDLMREARTALAGPWAEAALGGGDMLSSIGELFEVRVLAARVAALQGLHSVQTLAAILSTTAQIVEAHVEAIKEVADKLTRLRRITRYNCKKTLSRVRSTSINMCAHQSDDTLALMAQVTSLPAIEALIMQAEDAYR